MNAENTIKASNPKDAIGCKKPPLSVLPLSVLSRAGFEIGVYHPRIAYMLALGMLEGACKYGRHNYRCVGVRASIYYDAFMRHMAAYRDGEFTDPDSGLPHLIKAGTSLVVMLDAFDLGKMYDDRPPVARLDIGPHSATPESALAYWWDGGPQQAAYDALTNACLLYEDSEDFEHNITNWRDTVATLCTAIIARYPEPKAPFTQLGHPTP